MGLDAKGIADAIGIAVSFAGGSLEANRSGGTIKRFQSGWAAKSAIQAATLASCGVDGPAQAFDGRYGFYRCFIDGEFDAAVLTRGLGTEWRMTSLLVQAVSVELLHASGDRRGARAAAQGTARGGCPVRASCCRHTHAAHDRRTVGAETSATYGIRGQVQWALYGCLRTDRRHRSRARDRRFRRRAGRRSDAARADGEDQRWQRPPLRCHLPRSGAGDPHRCQAERRTGGRREAGQLRQRGVAAERARARDKFADTAQRALSPKFADRLRTHVEEIAAADDIGPIAAILGSAAT